MTFLLVDGSQQNDSGIWCVALFKNQSEKEAQNPETNPGEEA